MWVAAANVPPGSTSTRAPPTASQLSCRTQRDGHVEVLAQVDGEQADQPRPAQMRVSGLGRRLGGPPGIGVR